MEVVPRIRGELRLGREYLALRRSGLLQQSNPSAGLGLPVILIPGLLAPDASLGVMAKFLKAQGFRARRAGIPWNVDCNEAEMKRLKVRVERAADSAGSRVAIVGQSRGGLFGRALAVRYPELVGAVVGLGSPLVDPLLHVHPFLHLQLELLAGLGDRRLPRLASHACVPEGVIEQLGEVAERHPMSRVLARRLEKIEPGDCCRQFWADLVAPFPDDVSFISIYSRTDGIVNFQSCLDPAARHLEVRSSHCGMAVNRDVFRAMLGELRDVAQRERSDLPLAEAA
jgi:pimeloyl-ACP methyl ester carboxylesterase